MYLPTEQPLRASFLISRAAQCEPTRKCQLYQDNCLRGPVQSTASNKTEAKSMRIATRQSYHFYAIHEDGFVDSENRPHWVALTRPSLHFLIPLCWVRMTSFKIVFIYCLCLSSLYGCSDLDALSTGELAILPERLTFGELANDQQSLTAQVRSRTWSWRRAVRGVRLVEEDSQPELFC